MAAIKRCSRFLFLGCMFAGSFAATPLHATDEAVIVGVNVVGVDLASDRQQDALIGQLQRYGVKKIRTALGGHGERYTSFVIKEFQHGIGAVVIVGILPACRPGRKPCWITEWGFNNESQACPLNDSTRAKVIQEERSAFKLFAAQGRSAARLNCLPHKGGWPLFCFIHGAAWFLRLGRSSPIKKQIRGRSSDAAL